MTSDSYLVDSDIFNGDLSGHDVLDESSSLDDSNDVGNLDIVDSDDSSCAEDSLIGLDGFTVNYSNNDKESKKLLSSTYDSSMIYSNDLNKSKTSKLVLSSPQTIIIEDASHYDGSINTIIQGIIDNAEAGSTIQFTGSSYENLCLKISKPLNIISKSGTVITSIFNVPVFTILYGGSGTNISGFTVDLAGSFVEASDVSGISISKNKISTKRNALILNEVYDSVIKDNVFSRFVTAIDVSNSGGISISKNNITPSNNNNVGIKLKDISSKKGISILNNKIIGLNRHKDGNGICFGSNVRNVLIKGNFIKRWSIAIDLSNSINNLTMYNNTISENGDGIIINGWINNFTFKKNVVEGNSGVGILFDYDFVGTRGTFDIENNYFAYNNVLDLQNKGDQAVSIGKNFANRKCARVGMKYTFKIKTRQNGNKYYFSVVDKNGVAVSGLPNFSAKLTINGKTYNVVFMDSKAYIDVGSGGKGGSSNSFLDVGEDNRGLNQWGEFEEIDAEEMSYYEELYKELLGYIPEDIYQDDSDYDDSNNESSSSNSHSGSGDSGVSSGSNSISMNGDLSGSSGASGLASTASSSSASPAPSQSSSDEDSASVKALSVDDETFRVIGVGGLVFLIILVIGLYYREDIIEMMKEG